MEFVSATVEQNVEKCRHFSIRGFVAEGRNKDRKTCWPFSFEELVEVLPPMHVPEFRYWRCKNCIKHAQNNDTVEENDTALCIETQDCSQDRSSERQRMTDACATIDLNDVEKNTDVSQHASRESSSEGKTTAAEKNKLSSINFQEKKFAVRKCNNIAAAKNNLFNQHKNKTAATLNQDTCLSEGCDGTAKEAFTSPKSEDGERRGKQVIDGRIRKPRTNSKRPSTNRPNLPTAMLVGKTISDNGIVGFNTEDEDVDFGSVGESESGCQITENENHMTRLDGTTGKRKRQKLRTLGSILSRCGEMEMGSSSSDSGASLGFDLNLSPSHQMVKERKMFATGDDDEVSLQMSSHNNAPQDEESQQISSPNNVVITNENSADKEQQVGVVDDHAVSSCKSKDKMLQKGKGKMFEKENGASSSLNFLGKPSLDVQTKIDVATQRYPYTDSGTPKVRGEENFSKRNEIVDGRLSHLEDPSKRPDIVEKRASEQEGNRNFEKSGNGMSEKASSDEIPIEIIELMAKNLYERRLGASEPNKCSIEMPSKKRKAANLMKNPEALGTELLMFLKEKISQKSKLHSSGEGKAKILNSANTVQSIDNAAQTSNRLDRIKIPPEQIHVFNGFVNQEKASTGPRFPTFSKNQESGTSQAPPYVGSSSRDFGYKKSTCSLNQEKSSSGAQFLFGASSSKRNFDYQTPKFLQNLDKPLTGSHLHVGSSNRTSPHQSPMFSLNCDKPTARTQLLPGSTSIAGSMKRNRFRHTCLQTSEAYPLQSPLSHNSTRPWMTPSFLPFGNSPPRKFNTETNTASKIPQCLELFPKGNQSLKPMNPLANDVDNRSANIDLEPSKRIHAEYDPFAGRDRRFQFNSHSIRPLDLYNRKSIPATDLLRLMDAGACPPMPINANKSQNLSQPCSLSLDHRQLEMSRFRQTKNKDIPALPSSSECFNGKHHTYKKLPSVARQVNSIRASLQNSGFAKMNPLRPDFHNDRTKEKAIVNEVPPQPKTQILNISPSEIGTVAPILRLQKRLQSIPAPMPPPTNRDGFCSVNRNPAEFTVPETENGCIIGYRDVNLKQTVLPTVRTALVKAKKKVKFAALDECVKKRNCLGTSNQ